MRGHNNLHIRIHSSFLHLLCIYHAEKNSPEENSDIQHGRQVVDVPEIHFNPLPDTGVTPESIDLRPPGNAGFYLVLDHVKGDFLFELFNEKRKFRSGAYQAHITPEHIDQLGKFIQTGLSDK